MKVDFCLKTDDESKDDKMTPNFFDRSINLISFNFLSRTSIGWGRERTNSIKRVTWPFGRFVFVLLIFMCCISTALSSAEEKGRECISLKAMGVTEKIKRYIIDKHQVTMALTLADSDRISHRLTNAIFKKFLQEVFGYQEIKLVHYNGTMNPRPKDYFKNDEDDAPPSTLVNLEVWVQPGSAEHWSKHIMEDKGSQGTGGRFGWYVWRGNFRNSHIILDHWRSYQTETVSSFFALTPEQLKQVKANFTKDNERNYYCPDDVCTEGVFIPDVCSNKSGKKCATLFAGQYNYSSFLIEQVIHQKLLVQIAWIGPNLTPQFILRFREDDPILYFSWWPSPISVLNDLLRVAFPFCNEVNSQNPNSYLCKYEMHALRKHSWKDLENYGNFAYETVERFTLHEEDYREILLEYNRKTSFDVSESLLQPMRKSGWDNTIIDAIACDWLNRTATNNAGKMKNWRPFEFNEKPSLWIAGIFSISDATGKYSSKTLVHAAELAINDINRNTTILSNYNLNLKYDNGRCANDEVLYAFIRYVRTPHLNFNRLIGILGPSCSDTVEPLAGIAKLFNTVIISYSAEGAIISDQGKYPYFFRTIPENMLYRYVYLQLFKEMKWKRLASLTEDGNKYSEYLTLLQDILQAENISIFNRKFPREARKDMALYLKSLKDKHYRIIIGDFYSGMACEIICEAYKFSMTARENFIWFLPRWFVPGWYANCNQNKEDKITCSPQEMLLALDGHLSLGSAYYADDDFVYHSGSSVGEWKRRYEDWRQEPPADYAGYTYDAVWTYAFALNKLLKENFTHAANMHSNTTNERFVQLLRLTDFMGVSGHINFPQGTSRQTIVNIMQYRSNFSSQEGTYSTVGNFYPDDSKKGGGTINLNSSAIEWFTPDGDPPGDGSPAEVVCGLEAFSKLLGVSCEFTIVITMLICFAIFACFIIAAFCIYKIKYEKIEVPPWQLRNLMNLDEWEIPRERVVINRTIGAGAFGTVYGGECMISEESGWAAVAVKTLKKGSTAENKLDFLGEAEMMKRFDHKNIVKLIGLSTRVEPIYMIMEFMLYGDLQTYLLARRHLVSERTLYNDDDEISNRRLTSMALDVSCALEYLASNKYVHRDVASRNCLVNADRVVKLSDFGMTRPVYENNYYRFNRKGMLPVRWMAPESLEDGIYTTLTDVWSYGVLLYEIITFGNFPFQGLSNNEVLEHVVKRGNTIRAPKGIRPQLERILYRCWARVPEERPSFTEIIEIFSSYTRLITPCLEVPLASVQTNDSDSLEIGIDPTRRVSVPKIQQIQIQIQQIQQPQSQQQQQQQQQLETTAATSANMESEVLNNTPDSGFNPSLLSGSTSGSSRVRRKRTPIENGGGPTMEPLLPLTSGDSYITRYVCLQVNNKSPDGTEHETSATEMTAV